MTLGHSPCCRISTFRLWLSIDSFVFNTGACFDPQLPMQHYVILMNSVLHTNIRHVDDRAG